MGIIRNLIGILVILALAALLSYDRSKITSKIKNIAMMFVAMLVLTFICLRTSAGITALEGISNFFSWLIAQAQGGISFVFGGIVIEEGASVFFFNVLLPLVFISALIGILNYIKVLPFIMKWVGKGINFITGMGEVESQFAISTAVLGNTSAFISIKEIIQGMDPRSLFTICLSGMSAVGASTLAAYMQMIPGEYVVVAVFLNIFAALVITSIMNPYEAEEVETGEEFELLEESAEDKGNFFDMLGSYITDGFNLAIIIAAMVIGFVSLITFLNSIVEGIFGITFTETMGYVFSPLAFIIGIPSEDIVKAGSLMATKLLTNEFVAMGEFQSLLGGASAKTQAMVATYLVSFSNFGTMGITLGAIKGISEKQSKVLSQSLVKVLLGSILSSLLVASVVGLFF
ncbi:NupC/NupG family nucleoside CNT transporter [Aerococcus sanguinicola]|uniref:NupC/NupG family nucleoside CNT transporter n=1 Tax=unclassified Aerococcus TaxID=2618060 RepID=UPI0008A63527|nr:MULTISPECIES: nucleoside transporter C-terminal domain-containing protein [unclassified Aerococcus]KAB0647295.1 NupC/NupG family nucleoside CNT transporter [Aerococcus sanguinicola]MDK6233243.1 nucleoside transporter C-terminal domain-containing protein [Aerococcus sp. UMB10185]MDK6804647.1 nucleoside transporter C-terminal domain-containing protein [Aerococcus sp. UMB7834]MDK6856706.1 nucleoside transporter C-terminal domain-containing protein [Aerococcus sp. UMB7533]MDK8503042.1 nucleosid